MHYYKLYKFDCQFSNHFHKQYFSLLPASNTPIITIYSLHPLTEQTINKYQMKNNSSKNLKKSINKPTQQQQQSKTIEQPQHHNLLQYYKNKIDSLCQQRLAWLAKFDQCKSKLAQKHGLKQKLLNIRNDHRQLNRSLVHHNVALLDQKLNVIRMERQNMMKDYRDAEQVVKIAQLMEEYPEQIQKMLPCTNVNGNNDQVIKNQLNIHISKGKKPVASRSSKKTAPNNFNIKHSLSQKRHSTSQYEYHMNRSLESKQKGQKITAEQLLQRQIVQLKRNQQQQLQTMHQLTDKLQDLIKRTKQQQKLKLNKQRQIVDQLNKEYKNLQKRHKQLAEHYFTGRRQQKDDHENLNKQREELLSKNKVLQEKVSKQIKVYEKENKAKQTLIIRKSQDFQQNYKAKMRAKQRNLQALKQNYQKMQNICIQKVKKLQKALDKARKKLQQAEQRKQFLVQQLRQQLHALQKRVQQQKNQRQQRELKMRIKEQKQKIKNQLMRQKQQKKQAKIQRNRLVQQSYKRVLKVDKSQPKFKATSKKHSKSKQKPSAPKKDIYGKSGEQSQEDDSLEMDDLDNIRRQIGELQTKIAADTR